MKLIYNYADCVFSSLIIVKWLIKRLIKARFGDMQIANIDVVECQAIFNGIDKPSVYSSGNSDAEKTKA